MEAKRRKYRGAVTAIDCSGQSGWSEGTEGWRDRGWRPLSGVEAKQQNGGQGKRNFPGSPPDQPSGIPEKGERSRERGRQTQSGEIQVKGSQQRRMGQRGLTK